MFFTAELVNIIKPHINRCISVEIVSLVCEV